MMLAGQMTSVPFDRTSSSGYFRMSEIIHRQRLSQAHVVRQYPAGRVLRLPPEEPREGLPLVREELKIRMLMYEGFSNQISPPLASNAD